VSEPVEPTIGHREAACDSYQQAVNILDQVRPTYAELIRTNPTTHVAALTAGWGASQAVDRAGHTIAVWRMTGIVRRYDWARA
jgi:hypothetical protein